MESSIETAAGILAGSHSAVALTGAGISVESGIPPFRGKGGVWERIDPMEYAHIDTLNRDPAKVWRGLLMEMKSFIDRAEPNDAHRGLATLERIGILKTVITQNVDGLHRKAGNTDVIEYHGNFAWCCCMSCGERRESPAIDASRIPPACGCGGVYRPEIVFFGEMIRDRDLWRSERLASTCDVMLVVGTSATVQPAAMLPVIAKQNGAAIIEINPEATPLSGRITDCLLLGNGGKIMCELLSELKRRGF